MTDQELAESFVNEYKRSGKQFFDLQDSMDAVFEIRDLIREMGYRTQAVRYGIVIQFKENI